MPLDWDNIADTLTVGSALAGAGAGALYGLDDEDEDDGGTSFSLDLGTVAVGALGGFAVAKVADVNPLVGVAGGGLLAVLARQMMEG